jgi:hypothetical protein
MIKLIKLPFQRLSKNEIPGRAPEMPSCWKRGGVYHSCLSTNRLWNVYFAAASHSERCSAKKAPHQIAVYTRGSGETKEFLIAPLRFLFKEKNL